MYPDTATAVEPERDGVPSRPADDDVVVLAWWQHPVNVIALIVAAALTAAMAGFLFGDARARPEANDVDIGFLQDMRVHHEQAVAMSFAFLDRPDTTPGLRTIARTIVMGQSEDIGRMIERLREVGADEAPDLDAPAMTWMGMSTTYDEMPGLASRADFDELAATTGTAADELFARLMIAHHEGGIHMAEYATEHAASGEVRRMATAMAESQRHEITEIEGLLA